MDAGRFITMRATLLQFIARAIVPKKCRRIRGNFSAFFMQDGTGHWTAASPIVELAGAIKWRCRFDFQVLPSRRTFMTITTAHIPAIVALVAGILILIMPRLLNVVVAIYLICVGLIGLGLLKWLHI
jgi:hypothetical protein